MLIEMPINLKHKTKEELISLLEDSCTIIEKQAKEIENLKNDLFYDGIEELDREYSKILDKNKR